TRCLPWLHDVWDVGSVEQVHKCVQKAEGARAQMMVLAPNGSRQRSGTGACRLTFMRPRNQRRRCLIKSAAVWVDCSSRYPSHQRARRPLCICTSAQKASSVMEPSGPKSKPTSFATELRTT